MQSPQAAEILKDSRWKGSQLIPCHVEGPEAFQTVENVFIQVKSSQTTEILKKTFWTCSQPVALQEALVS